MRTCVLGLAAVLLAAPAVTAQGLTEFVVYSQEREGNHDIYVASPDGKLVRRLTTDAAPDETPRCSPDGRYVAFLRGGFESGDIFRVDLQTGEELRLTNDGTRDSTPEWSPDSRALVHHTYRYAGGTELQLLDLATLESRRLTNAAGHDYEAKFAGPGRVVFSSNRETKHYRLYVVNTSDGSTRLLADTGMDAWNSRYSSRSNRIVFHSGGPGKWRLFTIGLAEGDQPQPLLDDGTAKVSGGAGAAPAVAHHRLPGRVSGDGDQALTSDGS